MKKVIFIIALVLMSVIAMGQTAQTTKVSEPTKSAKVIKADSKKSSTYTPTGVYYETSKGEKYEIYLHTPTRGDNAGVPQCYIQRTSKKTGKTYWQKIPVTPEELKG